MKKEKLKTLKDCKNLEQARQEGIKWLKFMIEKREEVFYAKASFRDFFNITEEYLK